ncbi:hypothetical protein Pst134EA_028894 [Puccinia striiformis f. sp. tritici]|uniref:hypothetical protein n=1 Tax=Puccinia striiformis f. sp. tritici TaxID=168172 RepID=UPI00200783C8|nr:hypothetical protein Pst134EA_028894 [Puccinia striiformis f. sp. tritici]KAH9446908.1 hypothetical protein Pst134EA_028894 [Puccinia striiformis f. sp. tritici]
MHPRFFGLLLLLKCKVSSQGDAMMYRKTEPNPSPFEVNWTSDGDSTPLINEKAGWQELHRPESMEPQNVPELLPLFPTSPRGDTKNMEIQGHATKRLRLTDTSKGYIQGPGAHLDHRKQGGLSYSRHGATQLVGGSQNPIDTAGLTDSHQPLVDVRMVSATRGVYSKSHLDLFERLGLAGKGPGLDKPSFSHSNSSPMQPFKKVASSSISTTIKEAESRESLLTASWLQWRRNEEVSQYYPSLILDWTPPAVSLKVACATEFMIREFLDAIYTFPLRKQVEKMHNSHKILFPFVYKLMTKQLTTDNWPRVLLVWRVLWHYSQEITPDPDQEVHQILKVFLWISDFITESTIPQLFLTTQAISHLPTTPAAKVLKILSNGTRKLPNLTKLQDHGLYLISRILNAECIQGNKELNLLAQHNSKEQILDCLYRKTQLIYSEILSKGSEAEQFEKIKSSGLWQALKLEYDVKCWQYGNYGLTYPAPINYMAKYPPSIDSRIDQIYAAFDLKTIKYVPVWKQLVQHEANAVYWLRNLDRHLPRSTGHNMEKSKKLPPLFLPQVIHDFFPPRFHRLMQWLTNQI